MSISPVQNQVNQFVQNASANSTAASPTTSFAVTPVTSSDPNILTQQKKTVQNEILQLQQNHGSAQNIQKLNQELLEIKKQLTAGSSSSNATEQSQSVSSSNSNSLDVKA